MELLPPQQFAIKLVDELGLIRRKTEKTILFENSPVRVGEVVTYLIKRSPKLLKKHNPAVMFLGTDEAKGYSFEVGDEILLALKSKALNHTTLGSGVYKDTVEFGKMLPVMDVLTGEWFILNQVTHRACSMSFESWHKSLGYSNKDLRDQKLEQHARIKKIYNPYSLKPRSEDVVSFDDGLTIVEEFNTYIAPQWRLEDPPESDECPVLVDKLLKHIFPDKKCRAFVMGWIFNAVMKRNDTYLVLNGHKGIGKGVFVESVLKSLVGKEHFSKAPMGFLMTHFNSVLEDNRIIYLDEQTINTQDKHNMLKDYINPEQNIEAKFKDAKKSKETYNSFVISNNSTADMYIKWDDRRFSVIDMTDKDLREVFTDEEIRDLTHGLAHDMDYQKQLGHWVLNHCQDLAHTSFDAWRGEAFWNLAVLSLTEWQRYLLELFQDNPIGSAWSFEDLKKGFKRANQGSPLVFPRRSKVNEFIQDFYMDRTEKRIAEVTGDEDGKWQVVSHIGTAEEVEEEDIFDDDDLDLL